MEKEEINARRIEEANYIISTHATIRKTAEKFGVNKSTVHFDVRMCLKGIDPEKAEQVDQVLKENSRDKHIRGGMATKAKFAQMKKI